MPTIRHPANPHTHAAFRRASGNADDESRRARTCLECVADERREAAVHQIRDVDTGDAARMVDEWV